MQCRTPKCEREALADDKWCRPHRQRLDRMRVELEEETAKLRKGKTNYRKCRHPGCDEFKRPGSAYCALHEDQETDD